ncbi:MAG: AMP-binding protein, partial [Acidimicrobiia bacterium]|nr:AMP-binding protein [Acidimicrobiia bacterium]
QELLRLAKAEEIGSVDMRRSAPPLVDPDAVCAAVFTSGTTGVPRAARLTWGNIEASARASAAHLGHRADDRWLVVLPLHHVGGLSIVWRSAREGSAVVLAGKFDASRAAALLADGAVSLGSFVGPMLEAIADHGLDSAPGFRHGLVGGGPVSERALSVAGMNLLATYGMTETASQVATADPADPDPDRLVPLLGADIAIEADGRISIAGPMVSPGDLDGPDRRGRLITSDLGTMQSGLLEVLGRADDVIVTGGENVMPAQVERVLARIPGAGRVAVVGLPDPRWGALVACAFTGSASPDQLAAAVRVALPGHVVPRRWLRVDEIPFAGIGKVDRAAVARLFD